MNKLYLISCGTGEGNITLRAVESIEICTTLIGAQRLLNQYATEKHTVYITIDACETAEIINTSSDRQIGVLVSGDAGFYSLAAGLRPLVTNREIITIPGVGVVQSAFARLNLSWQSCEFISLHGSDPMPPLNPSKNYLILTKEGLNIRTCLEPTLLSNYNIVIMENLYHENERIFKWDGEPYICRGLTALGLIKV